MRFLMVNLAIFMASGGIALACPDHMLSSGESIALNGAVLADRQTFSTTAGGENILDTCEMGDIGFGQFRSAPDFTFDV